MSLAFESDTRADLEHRLHAATQLIIDTKRRARRAHGKHRSDWPAFLRQQIEGASEACKHYRALLQEAK